MTDNNPIIDKDGSKFWYQNGFRHRTDGPACEWANGHKSWYQNGLRHRTDGPAIELINGEKYWYINGRQYSFKKWLDDCALTDEEKCELIITL